MQAFITGIGETAYTRPGLDGAPGELEMACQAIERAAGDAGVDVTSIDGLVSFADPDLEPALLQLELGLPMLRLAASTWGGRGGGACGALALAAMAVQTGQARRVAVFRSLSQTRTRRYGQFFDRRPHVNCTAPSGLFSPAQMMALLLRRHLHESGFDTAAWAEVVVLCRDNAQANPRAMRHGAALFTAADHAASPLVADPLRRADCCLESDGACAVLVEDSADACGAKRPPVRILAAAQGSGPRYGTGAMGMHTMPAAAYASGNARELAADLFARAGVQPEDVDVAQIYDHFSGMVLVALEDFGFAPRHRGAELVLSGALRHGSGCLPINTSGGCLAEGYVHGMNLIAEAARQIRGDSPRPVAGARVSFVCSGGGVSPTSAALLGVA